MYVTFFLICERISALHITMPEETAALSVDTTLTYDNARSRGYEWVMDVLRNAQGELEEKELLAQLVNKEGYALGQPWATDTQIVPHGLYKPMVKSAQQLKKV